MCGLPRSLGWHDVRSLRLAAHPEQAADLRESAVLARALREHDEEEERMLRSKWYARARAARNLSIRRLKGLKHVHVTAYVHRTASVQPDLQAAEYAFIGPRCYLNPGVVIGRYSMLAFGVAVVGDDHVIDLPGVPAQFSGRPPQSATTIGADVWVGRGAIIRRGVTIGDGAVVGAGAVVTKDVAPMTIVGGVPARELRERFPDPFDREAHERMLRGPAVEPSFATRLRPDQVGLGE